MNKNICDLISKFDEINLIRSIKSIIFSSMRFIYVLLLNLTFGISNKRLRT